MARLDVYRSPGKSGRFYVLDIQADLLADLATRVVVPLIQEGDIRKLAADLNPVFEIEGKRHVMLTQAIATVPRRELRQVVTSLDAQHHTVLRAIDVLLTGV
jgi:toxin CcdB